jgi:hypothetical protein
MQQGPRFFIGYWLLAIGYKLKAASPSHHDGGSVGLQPHETPSAHFSRNKVRGAAARSLRDASHSAHAPFAGFRTRTAPSGSRGASLSDVDCPASGAVMDALAD